MNFHYSIRGNIEKQQENSELALEPLAGLVILVDELTRTYMIRQLPPWFENLGKRQIRSPKIYLRDSGLLHHLLGLGTWHELSGHPKVGASWEGFALEQVLRMSPGSESCVPAMSERP
jgi:hypothetical protein